MDLKQWAKSCWKRKTTYQIPVCMGTFGVAIYTSGSAWYQDPTLMSVGPPLTTGLATAAGLACLAIDWKAESQKLDQPEIDREIRHAGLEGTLRVLYHNLLYATTKTDPCGLRVCIHAVDDNDSNICIQMTNYVGVSHPYGRGRGFSISKGITGECLRTGKTIVDYLRPNTQRHEHLMSKYGYTHEEVIKLNPKTQSWVAVPIGLNGRMRGAVYADSENPGFFGKKNGRRVAILQSSVLGIAETLK